VNTSNSNNGAYGVLAAALEKFTVIIIASIQTWQEGQAFKNADPELKWRYDNLILMGRIAEMERAANANSTTTAYSTPREANNHPVTPAHDNTTTAALLAFITTTITSVPVATSTNTNISADSNASDIDNNMASSVATTSNTNT
jgi:hypothetical protein